MGEIQSNKLLLRSPYVPVPVKVAFWVGGVALSVTETLPVLLPVASGLNVTVIVQLPPAATLVPDVFVWLKSRAFTPTMVIVVMLRVAVPVLLRVMPCDVLD
jgi:hypothetical protein